MKLWLCGMTNKGNLSNLKEMIDPIIDYFDGLVWTFHYPKDEGADYLEAQKKEGQIVYALWCQRHSYSMNHFLYQGPMVDDDYFLMLDSHERVSVDFVSQVLPDYIRQMKDGNISLLANYGKGLIFRYNEQLEFRESPHWMTTHIEGHSANIELPKTMMWHTRYDQRDPFEWVTHYAQYFIYPAGSNHALLGLELLGDPYVLFPPRETSRRAFRKEMVKRGFPLTLDGLTAMLSGELDDTLKAFLNNEKVWNDYYRYVVLKDDTVVHSHEPKHMKVIT